MFSVISFSNGKFGVFNNLLKKVVIAETNIRNAAYWTNFLNKGG